MSAMLLAAMASFMSEVIDNNGTIASMQNDIKSLKSDVAELKLETRTLRVEVDSIHMKLDGLGEILSHIMQEQKKIVAILDRMEKKEARHDIVYSTLKEHMTDANAHTPFSTLKLI